MEPKTSLAEAANVAASWWGEFLRNPNAGSAGDIRIDAFTSGLLNLVTQDIESEKIERFIAALSEAIVKQFEDPRRRALIVDKDYNVDRILEAAGVVAAIPYEQLEIRLPLKSFTKVELRNGDFWVTTKLGYGSEFKIIYPA